MALSGDEHTRRLEMGNLEQDSSGGLRYLRVTASHDAGEAECCLRGGDDQIHWIEDPVDTVQSAKRLGCDGASHDDGLGGNQVEVEGVQRLSELEHDVVGDIDDVADRALPGG